MHLRYTDDDITVIVLSNNESRADFIADGLSALILNKNVVLPSVHNMITQSNISEKYIGKFMMELIRPPYIAVFPVEFVNRNGAIYIHSTYGPDLGLKPESETQFFLLMEQISK